MISAKNVPQDPAWVGQMVGCFGLGPRRVVMARVPTNTTIKSLNDFNHLLKKWKFINENPSFCLKRVPAISDGVEVGKEITFATFIVSADNALSAVNQFVRAMKRTIMPQGQIIVSYAPKVDLSLKFR